MRWLAILRAGSAALFIASIVLGMITMRTMNDTRYWVSAAGDAVMAFSLAERTLQVDLLNARAGLLRNYDPMNADLASARAGLLQLERLPMSAAARTSLIELRMKATQQELLVERFNSDNALLQNSLTRFTANGSAEDPAHGVLSSRILKLTLDTSPQTVREARLALDQSPRFSDRTSASQLFSHARLLVTILPEIDELLQSIRAMDMGSRAEALQAVLREESAERLARVRHLESALATIIVLLIANVVALVSIQRLQTRELQAQAANERLSAAIATPLIDTGHATFVSRVQDAIRRLAMHIGARQLQLMIPGIANSSRFSWPDNDLSAEWVSNFAVAADADGAWVDDKVIASLADGFPPGALADAMRNAGIENLVLLRAGGPFRVVVGFEPAGRAPAQRRDHMASVASAIVAIAHGARREVMQTERERLERTLARARRMETIGAMASGVAHNFNNIIGAIGGFAEMGQERTRNGSSARYSFDEIQGAVHRARDLVDDILGFAKQGRSSKQPVDLSAVLTQAIRLLSASARDGEAFHLADPGTCLPVLGTGSELQQVFLNICTNALHVSGGEAVKIMSQRTTLIEERHLSHGSLYPNKYIVISITDHGPGIPESSHRRIFEPFFTTKASGTGLGLSTAWEIVQDHSGTIDVENIGEGGARFSVWIPEMRGKSNLSVIGKGAKIMLIAEQECLAEDEDLLAELGYEPVGFSLAADGEVLRTAVNECEGVLISSSQARRVEEALGRFSDDLGDCALLLSTPVDQPVRCSVPFFNLPYPLEPDLLADALWRATSKLENALSN